jgi:hypothetical protein
MSAKWVKMTGLEIHACALDRVCGKLILGMSVAAATHGFIHFLGRRSHRFRNLCALSGPSPARVISSANSQLLVTSLKAP